jgi:hypothetical protein
MSRLKNDSETEKNCLNSTGILHAMPSSTSKFKPLNELTLEWSRQGGEPYPLTLRRICDWAICDAFPEGTFIFANGERVDLLELHRAMRNAVGLAAPINEVMAIELLRRTLLYVTGIGAYCESAGVDLPKSLKTLRSSVRQLYNKPPYSAPPDCPNGADTVARLEKRFFAVGMISLLESLLRQRQDDLGSDLSDYLSERWLRQLESAETAVGSCGDPEIERELTSLKHEWEGLKGGRNHLVGVPALSDDGGNVRSIEVKKRAAGRPRGSGSYKRSDLVLVEEMRRGLENKEYSSIAAAAKAFSQKAAGHGTLDSRERRLINRYSDSYPS